MGFQVPRRDHFPRPLGDNSPHTPPDPEPGPVYKKPVLGDYVEARERWVQTGDMMALWEMEDNVAAVPAGWGEPDSRPPAPIMSPAMTMMQAAAMTHESWATITAASDTAARAAHRKGLREVAFGFAMVLSALLLTLVAIGVI